MSFTPFLSYVACSFIVNVASFAAVASLRACSLQMLLRKEAGNAVEDVLSPTLVQVLPCVTSIALVTAKLSVGEGNTDARQW